MRQNAVTATVGVAIGTAADTAAAVIQRADNAMYEAKAAGRARVELFSAAA